MIDCWRDCRCNLFSWDTEPATACSAVGYFALADLLGQQAGLLTVLTTHVDIRLLLGSELQRRTL